MGKMLYEGMQTHDCDRELVGDYTFNAPMASIYQCSCGKRFICVGKLGSLANWKPLNWWRQKLYHTSWLDEKGPVCQ